jgi:ankyrin repeat protein
LPKPNPSEDTQCLQRNLAPTATLPRSPSMKPTSTTTFSRRAAFSSLGAWVSLSAISLQPWMRLVGASADERAFLDAVRRGDLDRVQQELSYDSALARATDERGKSAYVLAQLAGHRDVATALSETGLRLDAIECTMAEDWKGLGDYAEKSPELMNHAHPVGGTPLHAAALVGSTGFWRLRSHGCSSDAIPTGGNGYTAARTSLDAANEIWAMMSLTDLCSNGADPNAKQLAGSSVLHGAVLRKSELLVRLAIRKGSDVAAVDAKGRSALALAQELGWTAGTELLKAHLALPRDNRASRFAVDANLEPIEWPDMDGIDRESQSEVTSASHFNLKKVQGFLASEERLVFSISTDDELAIEACAHTGVKDVMKLHLDHGAPYSLPTAVSMGDTKMVKYWLDKDATLIRERGAHDFPLMWYALNRGTAVEMAELLVAYGADLDQESMGTTALHWAIKRPRPELVAWLVENGADPERMAYKWDRDGITPMQLAKAGGSDDIVRLLKAAGAKR